MTHVPRKQPGYLPTPRRWWVPFALVLVMLLAVSCCVGCASNQEIIDTSADVAQTIKQEQDSLAQEATALFGELVATRDSIWNELTAIAGLTDDELVQEAIEEARDRITEQLTHQLKAMATRLSKHADVLRKVVEDVNKIHQLALDQQSLMAILQAPLTFFGFPPHSGGSAPTRPAVPASPGSGGVPWGPIIGGLLTAYVGTKGTVAAVKAVQKGKRRRQAREAAQDAMIAAIPDLPKLPAR